MRLHTIIAISMVSAIGGLVFNTMPLLVQSLGASLGLTEIGLGNLSLAAGVGYLIGTLSGPLWIDRFDWRRSAILVSLWAALSFVLSAHVQGMWLYASWVGFGFFCALMHALCMRMLAEAENPELAYGTRLSVELITISVLLYALPVLFIAQYGYLGAAYGLAVFVLVLGCGAFFMPRRSGVQSENQVNTYPAWRDAPLAWSGLSVFLLYLMANVGLWIFLAVLAEPLSPTPDQFSLMFSVLKVLGGVAGFLGAAIGARLGLRIPHIACMALVVIGLIGLYQAEDFISFMVSSWIWEFGFTLGCLYQTAGIARSDPSGKLVVLVTTAFGISILSGGWLAGHALALYGASILYVAVAVCALISMSFYLAISAQSRAA